jgi:hypothetical protein
VLNQTFTPADSVTGNKVIRIPESQLTGTNAIRITKKGSGRLYWSARAEYYSTDKKVANTGSFQLSATREFFRLSPTRNGDRIVYKLESLPETLNVGDLIAVRITVGGNDWRYLMIEDPIPSGTEAIQRDDLYELDSKPAW